VRTAGGAVLADNGAWHAFTVATAALFSKQAPGHGATGLGSTVTLQWAAVPDEGYWVCWDTSDNGSCDSAWWPNGGATARVLEGLSADTYYWQVKTAGGGVQADNGAWHHFTVGAAPLASSTAGPSGGGAPGLASAEHRSTGRAYAAGVAGAASLALAVLLAGPRRRRRVVAAGVMVFVLAPAAALAQTTTQVVEYYTTDALGSVRAVTQRVNGVLQVTRHDFMPFGEEVAPPTASQDKRLFTGKERDAETGMDYFGARYYRAAAGRFTTVDPVMTSAHLTNPQTFSRYAYARNNPLRYVDPDGRDVSKECIADKKCTIELKVNVIYDQRNPLSAAQKASVEKAYLAKAQGDFKHSNIKIDYTYTDGRVFESGGQVVVEGARSDSLNAVFTTGREATMMPGGSLSASGVTFVNVAHSGQGESNVFLWSNTLEHEMGHVMRGGVHNWFQNLTEDGAIDSRLLLQSFGMSITSFREGLEHRAFAVEANPAARVPKQ
jgi:RHS repeat-associated protein